jgi:hypothetical protein
MKVNLTPEEFSNFVASYLLDCLLHIDEINMSDDFREIVDVLDNKGMKSFLLMKYLKMDSNERLNYKRIRKSVTDLAFKGVVEIMKNKE